MMMMMPFLTTTQQQWAKLSVKKFSGAALSHAGLLQAELIYMDHDAGPSR